MKEPLESAETAALENASSMGWGIRCLGRCIPHQDGQ